jgi:hypothetical protein
VEIGAIILQVSAAQPVADLAKNPTIIVIGDNNNGIVPLVEPHQLFYAGSVMLLCDRQDRPWALLGFRLSG